MKQTQGIIVVRWLNEDKNDIIYFNMQNSFNTKQKSSRQKS